MDPAAGGERPEVDLVVGAAPLGADPHAQHQARAALARLTALEDANRAALRGEEGSDE